MLNPFFVLTRAPDEGVTVRRPSYADVTERLLAEFGAEHGLKVVSDVIMESRTCEDGLPKLIAPESLEQMARLRLGDLSPADPAPAP
jgi:hypothetical protein